jgi:hypothetical protein
MVLRELKDPLIVLLQDAEEAETNLDANPESQFARRTYIRSIFSALEGTVWLLKTACLAAVDATGKQLFTPAELALLREESYELRSNGEIKVSAKFLKLPDNIRFIYKFINKRFNSNIDTGSGGKKWEQFLISLEIRNRITHPKNTTAFIISDEETEICKGTSQWFCTLP